MSSATPPAERLSVGRKVKLTFAAALVVVIAVGATSLRSTSAAMESARSVAHTQEVVATVRAAFASLVEVRGGARGYVITGDSAFLESYQTGLQALKPLLDEARRLTADNPGQQERLVRLEAITARALTIFARDVETRRTRGLAAAARVVATREGKRATDDARRLVAEIEMEERRLLAQRTDAMRAMVQQARLMAMLGTVAAAGVAFAAAWWIGRDLSGRQRAEAALRDSEARLHLILQSMTDGVVVADEQGRFTLWNPAAERIGGMRPSDAPPEAWSSTFGVFRPDERTPFPADELPLVKAIRGEASRDVVLFQRNSAVPDGVHVNVSGSPLVDARGTVRGGVVIVSDITERRRAQRDIERANAELAAVNQELETFSYSVSHDLRAPLRAIDGFSRLLVEDHGPALDADARRLLDVVRDNTRKMGHLIDDLLAFSRLSRKDLAAEPLDMAALARSAVEELRRNAPGPAVVDVAPLPPARGDAALLRQVWINLIGNALKYSGKRPDPKVEIGAADGTPSEVAYFVRDNGVGFDMAYAGKLFQVFQRLHGSEFEGTGVGLAIVQRVVHRHGGRVWAEGAPGRGATFSFSLPAAGG